MSVLALNGLLFSDLLWHRLVAAGETLVKTSGLDHPGAIWFGPIGKALDFQGGYLIFEVIWVVLFNWYAAERGSMHTLC